MYITNDIKICVIGGDNRMLAAIRSLCKKGFRVYVFGITGDVGCAEICNDIKKAVYNSQAIILPLPCSTDGIRVFSPLYSEPIKLEELVQLITKEKYVIGGKMPERFTKSLDDKGCKTYDYYTSERLTVLNAVPTAEGAVAIAVNETKKTVFGSKCAVCGYGRIGKLLSKMLKDLGADVTVFARSEEALTWAEVYGYNAVPLNKAHDHIVDTDILFNTVPATVIDKKMLEHTKKDVLIIDLASSPGGVDVEFAKNNNRRLIFAGSLPGKVAPDTAGSIIADCVISKLKGSSI
ncbi:MAG: dipicolinate synthase subunit DpsA [Clostridia bacterium]|nr:dipicolinate synthase subunit DpsA [Clostridia bacterium]